MPRIPLRDIPNAPGAVAQPTLNMPRVNLGTAQSLLQQSTISPDAFQGEAKGMQVLAAGVGSIAGAADKFASAAKHVQAIVDEDMLFKGKGVLEDAALKGQDNIAAQPENYKKHGEIITGQLDGAYEGFLKENPDLSEQAKRLFTREYESMRRILRGQAQQMGLAKASDNVRRGVLNNVQKLAENDDVEDAVMLLQERRGSGLFSDSEIEQLEKKTRKTALLSGLARMRVDRPDLAEARARDEWTTPGLSRDERAQEVYTATVAKAWKDSTLMEEVLDATYRGDLNRVDEVRSKYGEYGAGFVERNFGDLEKVFQAQPITDYGRANEIIMQARTTELPADEAERVNAFSRSRSALYLALPEGKRQEYGERLREVYFGEPRKLMDQQLDRWMMSLVDMGGFGGHYDEKEANKGNAEEMKFREQVFGNVSKAEQAMSDWRKANPRASDMETRREFQNLILNNGWLPPAKDDGWLWPNRGTNRGGEGKTRRGI